MEEPAVPEKPLAAEPLSGQLRDQLLARVSERLQRGEVLVSNAHFIRACEEEY